VYTLTSGGPGFATHTFDFLVYEEAFAGQRPGYASAIGVFLFGIVLVLTIGFISVFRRARGA
jgi:raffinose/stachyose/melibiose transport system permease protein